MLVAVLKGDPQQGAVELLEKHFTLPSSIYFPLSPLPVAFTACNACALVAG